MQMIAAMLCLQGCSPKGPLTGGGCIKIDLDDGELDIWKQEHKTVAVKQKVDLPPSPAGDSLNAEASQRQAKGQRRRMVRKYAVAGSSVH